MSFQPRVKPIQWCCSKKQLGTAMFIPREVKGYSVELCGLYVCPNPILGGVHCITFAATPISAQQYDLCIFRMFKWSRCDSGSSCWIFENILPKLASKSTIRYMTIPCSRRGRLRYVCGQTIHPTAMICAFLESPTDLHVDRCAFREALCFFRSSSLKLTSPN